MDAKLQDLLDGATRSGGRIVVLTGAGISAESGIPTFRGKDGYWTVGSHVYHPQALATWAMFSQQPDVIWPWYLWRRSVCNGAVAGAGHLALVALEKALGARFLLVTQNVDGLHARAGSSADKLYEIHGNINLMRCSGECAPGVASVPAELDGWSAGRALGEEERALLHCTKCGKWLRPHVLWFDETYDEPRYRYSSSLAAASNADLLLIVGTSGATTLPALMAQYAARAGAAIVDVNPEDNPFAELARKSRNGAAVRASAGAALPEIVARLS